MADLSAQQGATFRCTVNYKNPDSSPVNLTGLTFRMQVRGGTGVLLSTTDGSITAVITPLAGSVAVRIGADKTAAMAAGTFAYGMELVSIADPTEVVRLASGSLSFSQDTVR